MKQKLYNIHKLIGINVALIFYISIFFGLLTIYKPYIHIWESNGKHFQNIKIEDINLNKCVNKLITYKKQNIKDEDVSTISLPNINFTANNSISLQEKGGIDLNPYTCEEIKHKDFEISDFFEELHYGGIGSILFKFLFGFVSVAVLFLTLSGTVMVLKTKFSNKKPKSAKSFFAKYHRVLLLYTVPLIVMFALTGALFNLGVYTSPIITNYLTDGKTSNILSLEKNILRDKKLDIKKENIEIKTLNYKLLYKKAKSQFSDISFYKMEVYNYNDQNARVKFIGYEPENYFLSSVYNDTNIVLDATNANVISKKMADEGTFTEKFLDSVFYLHFLKTFNDLPRHIFILLSFFILVGVTFSLTLWLSRAKENTLSYKFLRPFSFTIILGSIFSTALLFASTWLLPKEMISYQEPIFYLSYVFLYIFIYLKNNIFSSAKITLFLSSFLFLSSVILHQINTGYSIIRSYTENLNEVFIMDIALIFISLVLFLSAMKLSNKYFDKYSINNK